MERNKPEAATRGIELLRNPSLNRSLCFSESERDKLGLHGLLPEAIESEAISVERIRLQIDGKGGDFDRYLTLSELRDADEELFFRVLRSDTARYLPLVYTPVVGEACLKWSQIFRRPRGLYFSLKRKGRIRELLRNWPERDVRFVVVTSGERILGLGDLGANGMGIPIGKLALYSAAAGIPPRFTLPITLDCGTNNDALLNDPLYIGLRRRRPASGELDEFVEEFVTAIEQEFPGCCIQWEDWARADAFRLLARYRDRVCSFNDDIQGSGAVVLAGLLNAVRITGSTLAAQRFLFLGAGAAAVGIADILTQALKLDGLSEEEARGKIWLSNRNGLVESTRGDLSDYQRRFAQVHSPTRNFVDVIESIRPTVIIGVSTAAKAFDQRVVEAMARHNSRPIIFALSNPTSRSECTAEEAYRWSEGRAVFASGSPFAPVDFGGRRFVPGQCNNLYIFPALGLAIYNTRCQRVSDEMFIEAARALAQLVTEADLQAGLIYPPQSKILETERAVAERISKIIYARGLNS